MGHAVQGACVRREQERTGNVHMLVGEPGTYTVMKGWGSFMQGAAAADAASQWTDR